ncbi:MAG: inovirus-type Gp2 protein [Algicola sp.]|nr:inovirus-type Gp2 protein [Algicola sp.]
MNIIILFKAVCPVVTKRCHDTKVRYVWCREIHESKQYHFHFLLMLNNDAYNTKDLY